MLLHMKIDNGEIAKMYENHSHYHEGDSGLDLYCPQNIVVKPGETVKIDLKIQCEAFNDKGNVSYYLYPRSSIVKTPLRLSNSIGIIDAGYRGNIKAFVDNIKTYEYTIEKGHRLFQICSGDLSPLTFKVVKSLSDTSRGQGGFGSTGVTRNTAVDYGQEPEPEISL